MQIDMNSLGKILDKDEQIEWVGKSEPFKTYEGVYKKRLLIRWLICGVLTVVLSLAYVMNTDEINYAILVIVIGILGMIAFVPFTDARALQKRYTYALTNKHAILFQDETTYTMLDLSKVKEAKIFVRENGVGDIAIGASLSKKPEYTMRFYALAPTYEEIDEQKHITGLSFVNIPDVEKVKSILCKDAEISIIAAG